MSRIFFAGGLRGWLQTVPAPGVAAAGPSPTTHRSTRLGAQPRPLQFPQQAPREKSPPQSALGLRLPTCRPTGLAGSFGWSLIMPCGRIANKRTAPTWRCIDADLAPCGSGSRSALVAEGSPPPKGCCWAASWPLGHICSGGGCRRQLRPRKRPHTPCCKKHAACTMLPTTVARFDVVKTRLQAGSASGTTMQVMRAVVRAEGWRALFSGWTAAVARAFPANAGLFAGVELASRLMGSSG